MHLEFDLLSALNLEFDILIVGDNGVGKSTLLHKYTTGNFCDNLPVEDSARVTSVRGYSSDTAPAIGKKRKSISMDRKMISIIDSNAPPSFFLTDYAFLVKNARTFLFTYSIDSLESFEALEYAIDCINALKGKPIICAVVALKMDLIENQQVSSPHGVALSEKCGSIAFYEVSSKLDSTVEHVFSDLTEKASELESLKFSLVENSTPSSTLGETPNEKSNDHESSLQRSNTTASSPKNEKRNIPCKQKIGIWTRMKKRLFCCP